MTADDRLTPLSLAVLLLGAGLCLWGSSALAAAAGQVQFVAGPVQLDRGGRSQAVVKGAQVEAGDVLRSGPTGQAQIRFTDGGIMALYPQSQISIGAYSDSAQAGSGEDRFAVRFVQGALRAVTGKIGQRNPQSYQVITPTAVVGIRGTAFKIFMNAEGEVEVSGEHNTIEVCTEAGCVEVKPREAVRVPSAEQLPVYIHTRGMLAMPLPRSSFQVGEQLLPDASNGAVRLEISPPSITPQNPNSGSPPVVAPPQVTNPVNPTTPIAPEPPTPVTPSNPVVPINPGGAQPPIITTTPVVPARPVTPQPPNPVVPINPVTPTNPGGGQQPGVPTTPVEPTTPTTPTTTPIVPIRPIRPIIPIIPIVPIVPAPPAPIR